LCAASNADGFGPEASERPKGVDEPFTPHGNLWLLVDQKIVNTFWNVVLPGLEYMNFAGVVPGEMRAILLIAAWGVLYFNGGFEWQ